MSDRAPMTPVTVTLQEFAEISRLGMTTIYKMIKLGELKSARIHGRRMIVLQSYLDLVRQSAEEDALSRIFAVARGQSRQKYGTKEGSEQAMAQNNVEK